MNEYAVRDPNTESIIGPLSIEHAIHAQSEGFQVFKLVPVEDGQLEEDAETIDEFCTRMERQYHKGFDQEIDT